MLRGILCSLSYNFQQILIAQIGALQHESPLLVLGILDLFGSRTLFFLISSRAFCSAWISFLFLEVVVANGAMAAKLSVLALAFSAFSSLVGFFPCLPAATSAIVRPASTGGAGQARLNEDGPSCSCTSEAGAVGLSGASLPTAIATLMLLLRSIS